MNVLELYKTDIALIEQKLAGCFDFSKTAYSQSNEWWELKGLRDEFRIIWREAHQRLDKDVLAAYQELSAPYRNIFEPPEEQYFEDGKPIVNEKASTVKMVQLPKGKTNIDKEIDATEQDLKEHYGSKKI